MCTYLLIVHLSRHIFWDTLFSSFPDMKHLTFSKLFSKVYYLISSHTKTFMLFFSQRKPSTLYPTKLFLHFLRLVLDLSQQQQKCNGNATLQTEYANQKTLFNIQQHYYSYTTIALAVVTVITEPSCCWHLHSICAETCVSAYLYGRFNNESVTICFHDSIITGLY